MITVHHLENSRSHRLLWLLEEMGLSYEMRRYERHPETSLAPPELQKIHPLGKAPILVDDELVLAESGAIIEYLMTTYDAGTWRPTDGTAARRDYNFWLHYAEGSVMPLMLLSLIMSRIETAPMPFFVKPIAKQIAAKVRSGFLTHNVARHLRFMDDSLANRDWFCGDELTAADIQMSFPVEAAEARSDLASDYPRLSDFLARIRERPAYRRAIEKGGPYQLMGGKSD
ncbi:MAG: glutathione S-transferase [Pseudomonadota bacterium]